MVSRLGVDRGAELESHVTRARVRLGTFYFLLSFPQIRGNWKLSLSLERERERPLETYCESRETLGTGAVPAPLRGAERRLREVQSRRRARRRRRLRRRARSVQRTLRRRVAARGKVFETRVESLAFMAFFSFAPLKPKERLDTFRKSLPKSHRVWSPGYKTRGRSI